MTPRDVLAEVLHDQARPTEPWADVPEDLRESWRLLADSTLERMAEVTPPTAEDPPAVDMANLTIRQAVDLVDAACGALNGAALGSAVERLDWKDAVRLLADLRDAAHLLGVVDNALVKHIYLTGEHGKATVEGVGQVQVSRSRDRRKWDERGVVQAVLDARMTERGGEMPNEPWEVAEWLLEVLGVGYCRVTPLRAMGINPADYCEDTPGNLTVSLPPRT